MTDTPTQLAVVMLVDRNGALLLQLRDEYAPKYPSVWGLPGGHCEPGETAEQTARRELWEETNIQASGVMELFDVAVHPHEITHYFYCVTSAGQDDVIVGEGAAMVFVAAADVLVGREFTPGTADILARFLASPQYGRAWLGTEAPFRAAA